MSLLDRFRTKSLSLTLDELDAALRDEAGALDDPQSFAEKAGRVMSQANLDRQHEMMRSMQKIHDGTCDMGEGCPLYASSGEKSDEDEPVEVVDDVGIIRELKGLDGEPRWFAIWTNNYEDRAGETFAAKAHEDYVDHVWRSGEMPALDLWHIPRAILGRAEAVDYHDGFGIAFGSYERPEYAERLKELGPLKCSHRFRYKSTDRLPDGTFTRYRTDRITVLPAGAEANALTGFYPGKEEPMKAEMQAAVKAVFGEDKLAEFEADMARFHEHARKEGTSVKALFDDYFAEKQAAADGAQPPPSEPPTEPPTLTLDAIKAAVGEMIAPLAEKVTALATETEGLKAAQASGAAWMPRTTPPPASQRPDTLVSPDGPLAATVAQAQKDLGDVDQRWGHLSTAQAMLQRSGLTNGAKAPEGAAAR